MEDMILWTKTINLRTETTVEDLLSDLEDSNTCDLVYLHENGIDSLFVRDDSDDICEWVDLTYFDCIVSSVNLECRKKRNNQKKYYIVHIYFE